MTHGLRCVDVSCLFPDHSHQLALVVEAGGAGGRHVDVGVGIGERAGQLGEQGRVRRELAPHLGYVGAVVEADAEDRAGRQDRAP